jgi:hypothetical protein
MAAEAAGKGRSTRGGPRLEEVYVRSERMVGRRIAGEYVLVPVVGRGADADSIYNLNRVGSFVWEQMDGRRDGAAIAALITEAFDVDRQRAEKDYLGFVSQLLSIQAVHRASR